jgi:hypothetical protein
LQLAIVVQFLAMFATNNATVPAWRLPSGRRGSSTAHSVLG